MPSITSTHEDESEIEAIRDVLSAMIKGGGRGTLTYIAKSLNVTPSMLRKRLAKANGFDAPTMRAIFLISKLKSENMAPYPIDQTKHVGPYRIDKRTCAGETIPTWSVNGE